MDEELPSVTCQMRQTEDCLRALAVNGGRGAAACEREERVVVGLVVMAGALLDRN